MTKIKAYSYLRISNDQQKVGDGIRRQMEASKIYADQHGYDLVETMSDIGISEKAKTTVVLGPPNLFSSRQCAQCWSDGRGLPLGGLLSITPPRRPQTPKHEKGANRLLGPSAK